MGCTCSVYAIGRRKKKNIPQVNIFVPSLRVPVQTDLKRPLRGLIPKDLADRISSLRNQIVLVAGDTGGSAIAELLRALEEYLSLLVGLTEKDHGLQELVEFKWKNLEEGRQEVCVQNSWFEVLSTIHMIAVLTLMEANSTLIVKDNSSSFERVVSGDSMRNAVDLLLKAAGYLEFCVQNILIHLPTDIKNRLPKDLQEGVLQATSIQALGQGTEMQLSLAVESQNATLSVKRRLACEQLSYFGQAHYCLSTCNTDQGYGKKQLLFIKWKYLEAKAAAYYYHGLIVDKGSEPSCHISAVYCFFTSEELLAESKKVFLSFCLAAPVTRGAPPWGAMNHLSKKIPETASKKSQMYGYLLGVEKDLQILPELPEFQLSLKPDDYELPEMDSGWDHKEWEIPGQMLKEHLIDSEDEMETI
ncbi:hypothetical protein RJ639_042198 [Escallonia herrerae]|uniref:BRO1 domain-containing protein n=1 Tax=Escallonia herrerae TaxID=1293975 RepID=A0AA89B3U2_9ASTE|nr:hypothetical protein RJ639_042198 [Escallonia herrerae]